MSNDELNNIPQNKTSADDDINSFLDSLTTQSGTPDDFLDKLYDNSFGDLTSDFDSLLKEFQSIDPDDVDGGEEPVVAEKTEPVIEDIFSYSEPEETAQPEKKFSEAIEEAMEVEMADESSLNSQIPGETFRLSLDQIEGNDQGFGQAVRSAQRTNGDAPVRRPQQPNASQRQPQNRPAPSQSQKKPAKKKKKSSLLPNKNDSTFEIFRKVLFMVSVAVVVVCLGIIGNTYLLQPQLEKRRQAEVGELRGSMSESEFIANYGDTDLPAGANFNLAQFYQKNNDFYGYLEIPGTSLSAAVVQGNDNSKYLRKNFFGQNTKYGCPFVNYKNTRAALDYNTSIFGHNMEYDDLVFGELEKYRTIDGFKKAPLIHFETMYADHYFKIYAVFLTDSSYDQDGWYFNYIFTQLKDEAECKEYINELNTRRLYSTGVDIQPTDKLLTLSTCAYDFSDERLVVVGRLVRDGESKDVDVSKAMANSNPRYPAKYYAKKGMTNPYANAPKWIPNT